MLLRGKEHDPMIFLVEEHEFPNTKQAHLASGFIRLKHLRIALFECQSQAFSHYANGVDGINENPCRRFKDVAANIFKDWISPHS